MYVKVTAGHGPNGMHGDFLCEVTDPIYFDYVAAPIGEDATFDEDGKLTNPGSIDFNEALHAHIEFMHLLELNPDQTRFEDNQGIIAFRYVWWNDPELGITAVITTRRIFIVGPDGRTIDRV